MFFLQSFSVNHLFASLPLRPKPVLQSSTFNPQPRHCRSYSPLPNFLKTLNPAFLASEVEGRLGELNTEKTLRTGFLQAGQFVSGLADKGRFKVNLPPQTAQLPSHSSYS